MKQVTNENASNRSSYVGHVYHIGENKIKNDTLNSLPKEWADLHRSGYIHIHDLDAYGLTYNCLNFNILYKFPYEDYEGWNDSRKIIHLFDYIKDLFVKIGNEQSGGMAFPNFDNDMATIFTNLSIVESEENLNLIEGCIGEFISWCSNNHTRMGMTTYYITLNVGLANTELARKICWFVIDQFENAGDMIYKPNIIFKVHEGVNRFKEDSNYYLLEKSLLCTSKKMIPTYIICDSTTNKVWDPNTLGIMGCRTKVMSDLYGYTGTIGRSNIDNISINLPKIAMEAELKFLSIEDRLAFFYEKYDEIAETTKDILLDRFYKTCKREKTDFPINMENNLWCVDFSESESLYEIFKHGTISLGFIGLSEAIEVITNNKFYSTEKNYKLTLDFVKHMKAICDRYKKEYKLNFSLLATSGELISGRFTELDKGNYNPKIDIFSKGYYTNSFHVDVDSKIPSYKKIQLEGLFHEICNGGCITYVELGEAPLSNIEGLKELIEVASNSGTHYLGFNFPKDICNECSTSGVFDVCPNCKSSNITRLRRVSGYLEILDGFTNGKKNEEKNREKN